MILEVLKKSVVWGNGYKLTLEIYEITKHFPHEEKYGLTSQIRRCSLSIPSNIAEGRFRNSRKEFARFLSMARGSCAELATQLSLAHDLGYIEKETLNKTHLAILEIRPNHNKMT